MSLCTPQNNVTVGGSLYHSHKYIAKLVSSQNYSCLVWYAMTAFVLCPCFLSMMCRIYILLALTVYHLILVISSSILFMAVHLQQQQNWYGVQQICIVYMFTKCSFGINVILMQWFIHLEKLLMRSAFHCLTHVVWTRSNY